MRVKTEVRKNNPLSSHMSLFGDSKTVVPAYAGPALATVGPRGYPRWLWIWWSSLVSQNVFLISSEAEKPINEEQNLHYLVKNNIKIQNFLEP